ncbi:DNA cytosine methyltransferase [Methylovorus glucosotrophus]|uniref:C-5 cytosine-specific DNA methylase n=1 Tax=Methylovorus glucosotrophus (strain SIP3-4) TaxID=582744 RepID=C6XEP6_METGS|nr:DNA cytosine methyltransferase [Methylovorus glucosotrophus]ACT52103.1 C-5 cytosine-specific DNA methylase [Methylovorus glucosotrophus SIP3-4]
MLDGYYIKKIGQNKGAPRVWLEGSQTARAGFAPGQRFDIHVEGQTIVLQANPDGSRVVSSKKSGDSLNPVIDINSKELLAIFDGMSAIRVAVKEGQIYLVPLASELKKQERYKRLKTKLQTGEPLALGSLSHGGGILDHAIHSGLRAAGIDSKLAFANEIREELLEHAAIHNDAWSENTQIFAAPMQELAFDERGLANIPKTEALVMGLPCSGASKAGKAKRGLIHPESHPEVGHLVVSALVILSKSNPAIVILENVPHYANSASADILRNQLRDMGYNTQERILNGKEWGTLENRDRWVMVAVTHGIEFDFSQLIPPDARPMRLGDVLEEVPLDDPRWNKMQYLKDKEVRDAAEGKNFKMQIFTEDSEHIGTLTKGYAKVRSTDPKIQHPEDPDLLRQITPEEHARIKQVPEHLIAGLSNTVAHEVLGQSVVYTPFKDLGQEVGQVLNVFSDKSARVSNNELPREVIAMGHNVVAELKLANDQVGNYTGPVVAVEKGYFIQDIGKSIGVAHKASQLDKEPILGKQAYVQYKEGHGCVKEKAQSQMSLSL